MPDYVTFGHETVLPMKDMFEKKVFFRDYDTGDLQLDCNVLREYSTEMYEDFLNRSEWFINLSKKGIKEILETSSEKRDSKGVLLDSSSLPKNILNFKIINFSNSLNISQIRQENLNRLFLVKGLIKRITKVIPRTKEISYQCLTCGNLIKIPQSTKKINKPTICSCGNKRANLFTASVEGIGNVQELNLEEMPEETQGKQPRQIRVYLEGDLTDPTFMERLQPGKKVEILGIIQKLPAFMTKTDELENISDFMLNAINLKSLDEEDDLNISEEDMKQIQEIAANNPLKILSENLSPSIYGHEEIKQAIVLHLVKGTRITRPDGTFTRGDINVILVGDPGVSKSVLLKATTLRSPRSLYISGTRGSGVGLTAMVKKDEMTGDFALEAGALVLASGATVALDEIEKMDKDQLSSLYEPLEGQTVSINKAGISATLTAQTSVLAAANPIKGKFDMGQPLSTQIDLPLPLISRFDVVFIMLDKINEAKDSETANHLLKIYKEQEIKREKEISIPLFKKYIITARKVKPVISDEIDGPLVSTFIKIRQQSVNRDGTTVGIAISNRHIEALLRLATAHAKLRLSEKVEIDDFIVAKRLFLFSLTQVGYDEETGRLDLSRLTQKVPVTKRGKMEEVLHILSDLTQNQGDMIPYHEILKRARERQIDSWETENFLEQLKKEAKVIEPHSGVYQLL